MAMTPLEINTFARQKYNAVGDDFFSDQEIYTTIFQACCEICSEAFLVEQSYTTSSVSGQQEYSFPTNAMNIKRITYDGKKLSPISFREDDIITVLDADTGATGTPSSYMIWNNIIYLRAVPDTSSLTIKVFTNISPQTVTATSTLEVPAIFQPCIASFVVSELSAKNKNYQGLDSYRTLWKEDLTRMKRWYRKTKSGDAFAVVKDADILPQTYWGNI